MEKDKQNQLERKLRRKIRFHKKVIGILYTNVNDPEKGPKAREKLYKGLVEQQNLLINSQAELNGFYLQQINYLKNLKGGQKNE
jgi:hypothetical protein